MHEILRIPEPDEENKKPLTKGINTVRQWIKPVGEGRFGLSFSLGKREIFVGVSIAKVVMETIVKRKEKKVLVRTSDVKVVDLQ